MAILAGQDLDEQAQLQLAQHTVWVTVEAYWSSQPNQSLNLLPIEGKSRFDFSRAPLPKDLAGAVKKFGASLSTARKTEAAYAIGSLYSKLIPNELRARLGVYYTPPPLVHRLIRLAEQSGVNWQTSRCLDPACGGGAFLAPLASRMAKSLRKLTPESRLKSILSRLFGFEIDPFGAWLSQVFVEVVLLDDIRMTGIRASKLVEVCDALRRINAADTERFDLVIGNPPYGRIRLSPDEREAYTRGLFGHANLYGLFTDLASRLTMHGGTIAYVTPTSFLAGQYFKALRSVLDKEAPPVALEFITERYGVFHDVLQETMLAVYQKGSSNSATTVHSLQPTRHGTVRVNQIGTFVLNGKGEGPWIIPRTNKQTRLVERLLQMQVRLADYGYRVKTGPLVWNRHKDQLRDKNDSPMTYPIVWAESVKPSGSFVLSAARSSHKPFIQLHLGQEWLASREECVLVQRTTAKEQKKRIVAAVLPKEIISDYKAAVVENHLNMLVPIDTSARCSTRVLCAILNSPYIDSAFRCISGSVAVSAYELESLPLPPSQLFSDLDNGALSDTELNTRVATIVTSQFGEGSE